jgi:hypothetical protein
MALSILGFNLGIELMQLFVIAITMPWLILLCLTPAYSRVRFGGAVLAGVAAIGWMASRVSGQANVIDGAMQSAGKFAPLALIMLALTAMSCHFAFFKTKVTQ